MANVITEQLHENWKEYTAEEIFQIQQTVCKKCPYKGKASFTECCDYFYITGQRREVRPELCEHYKDKVSVDRSSFGRSKKGLRQIIRPIV